MYIFSGAKVIAEYANGVAPSSPTREYICAGGALLARIDSMGTNYYHQDLSNRMVTNSSGGVAAEMGHFPFGESWYNATNDKLYFGGKATLVGALSRAPTGPARSKTNV